MLYEFEKGFWDKKFLEAIKARFDLQSMEIKAASDLVMTLSDSVRSLRDELDAVKKEVKKLTNPEHTEKNIQDEIINALFMDKLNASEIRQVRVGK